MKRNVLVIGNMKRFVTFMIIYTLMIAAIVAGLFFMFAFLRHSVSAQPVETLISLSDSTLLI